MTLTPYDYKNMTFAKWVLGTALVIATFAIIRYVLLKPLLRLFVSLYLRNADRGKFRCPNCGYDLRATPNRCPECGTTFDGWIPKKTVAKDQVPDRKT